ncbi:hypothetical protein ACF061_16690 [Streptomyces sp. NPDC015220]|uniref:hypothetical protein n=1 Tax=Streptomyces sp. NPDC015220 TaxID=3364947 RepID=UPI0036F7CCBB
MLSRDWQPQGAIGEPCLCELFEVVGDARSGGRSAPDWSPSEPVSTVTARVAITRESNCRPSQCVASGSNDQVEGALSWPMSPQRPPSRPSTRSSTPDLAANRKEQGDVTARIAGLQERLKQLKSEEDWLARALDSLPGAPVPGAPEAEPAAAVAEVPPAATAG